jgi:hypothetical protein
VACQTCHGEIQKMGEVYQFSDLSMGWCINCHRETEVKFNDNDYYKQYERYHQELKDGKRDDRNFIESQLVILDIDNKIKVDGVEIYKPRLTIEEALAYAVDSSVYGADRWLAELKTAPGLHGSQRAADVKYTGGMADVLSWDRNADKDSTGALKYFYYRKQLARDLKDEGINPLKEEIDDWYAIVEGREPRAPRIKPEEYEQMVTSFAEAMAELAKDYGSLDAKYGDRFRVGREGSKDSWPVSGGGDEGLGVRTVRSMTYGGEKDGQQWGKGGQTSTQIVALTKPIQSWTQPPLGQSDRPESPHFDDQAEKLFSEGKLKPSWWLPEDLKDNIESREEIAPTL